ncbi:AraC family transcriptional regulator [Leptospira sp. 96542]|nr:AraC family transcriptional regulator [Leptospira sp. 96542]
MGQVDGNAQKLYPIWQFVESNLEKDLGLNQIAFFSNYSNWHFHRLFKKSQGENIQSYIRRLKIEKAAYELKISQFPILEIAMEAGYESNEAFTKAFKKQMGLTPTQFRKKFQKHFKVKKDIIKLECPDGLKLFEFQIKTIQKFQIVYIRHIGAYSKLPGPIPNSKEVKTLLSVIQKINSVPENHKWVGVSKDDPKISKPNTIRFDLGFTVGSDFMDFSQLGIQTIEGGRHLQIRYRGSYKNLPKIYNFLLEDYLPTTKLKLRNVPPWECYLNPLEKNLDLCTTDIYLPIH